MKLSILELKRRWWRVFGFGLLILAAAAVAMAYTSAMAAESGGQDKGLEVASASQVPDKSSYRRTVEQADKLAPAQARALNKISGVNVHPSDLKEQPLEKGPGLNPVAWLFRPITKLQAQSVRLEQQIMKLAGPIAALQPGMLGLENRMTDVQGEMARVQERIVRVQDHMVQVQSQLLRMQKDIASMRSNMNRLEAPMRALEKPIRDLHAPLSDIRKPVSTVGRRLDSLDRQILELKVLIALVLTSIYVAAALIALGTPVAAILVWRNRRRIFREPGEVKNNNGTTAGHRQQ